MAQLDRDLRSTRPEDLARRFGRIAVAAAPAASVLRLIGATIDVVLDHRPKHPFVAPAMLGTLTLGLYGWNVGLVPNYLFVDEAMFALQAHSIATTAHDLSGR